jgi:hypothetical protein
LLFQPEALKMYSLFPSLPSASNLLASLRADSGSRCLSWIASSQKVPETWGSAVQCSAVQCSAV